MNDLTVLGVIIAGCGVLLFLSEAMENGYNVEISPDAFKLYKASDGFVPA